MVTTITNREFGRLKREPYIQKIYNARPRYIPPDGLCPNGYPYKVGKRIYNYILFGDDVNNVFPDSLEVISYVNPINKRSVPEKHHINIFLRYRGGWKYKGLGISDIPPDPKLVGDILWYGHKQYPPYHPTIYLYYQYLLNGGDRWYNDFLMLIDPWFRNLK